jgi:serine/threonine protein kinase
VHELSETPDENRPPVEGSVVSGQLQEGELFGDYEIVSAAGFGGMGLVYKATQRSLDRTVALKVIRDEIARMPEYRDRFLREAKLAASVDHPHVVRVYDVGEEDDRLFLAMQWVDGEDLRQLLDRSGRLAPERAVSIATQLAGALDAVHSIAGLVHRDVKPGNVLLGKVADQDHAYLTDFGVAKPSEAEDQLTRTGLVVGTAGYLSPEQIRGEEPGPSSDLYALGCLFFEALTGRTPFGGENEMALRWAHANNPRPEASTMLPALGRRYDEFLAVALAIEPDHRFATGRQFADALAVANSGGHQTAATPQPSVPYAQTAVGPPTPMPPAPQTPQPPSPMYPGYGYGTPPPAQPPPRSGSPLMLILLGLVAFAGIAVGALAATGVLSHNSTPRTITSVAATHVPRPVVHKQHGSPTARTSSCGGDLSVGPATSCPFAHNVEQAYDESSGGETDVTAYSPSTGETYTMHCTAELPHICTGGKGAAVYFTSNPISTPTSSPSPPPSQSPSASSQAEASASNSAGAVGVVENYWNEIKEGNYPAAWADETASEQGGESSFVHTEEEAGIESVLDQFSPGQISGGAGTVNVVELRTVDKKFGCRTWSGDYEVEKDGGRWLISKANIEHSRC